MFGVPHNNVLCTDCYGVSDGSKQKKKMYLLFLLLTLKLQTCISSINMIHSLSHFKIIKKNVSRYVSGFTEYKYEHY